MKTPYEKALEKVCKKLGITVKEFNRKSNIGAYLIEHNDPALMDRSMTEIEALMYQQCLWQCVDVIDRLRDLLETEHGLKWQELLDKIGVEDPTRLGINILANNPIK